MSCWKRRSTVTALTLLASVTLAGALRAAPTPGDAFRYRILSVTDTAPGQNPVITFAVDDPSTQLAYNLATHPAWTQTKTGDSRLFIQIGWDTRDITNEGSGTKSGAALPIGINALNFNLSDPSHVNDNSNGTYWVRSPRPIPDGTTGVKAASGTLVVAMEGHPAAWDPTTQTWVRVPVKSAYTYGVITGTTPVARRTVVDVQKCMNCHKHDGTGVAPQLTLHGNNRTEEPQVCALCHNANNTDISQRLATDPTVVVGPFAYREQSIDFKRLVHGIHASSKGFRETPLVVYGFGHSLFDASTLKEYPGELKDCVACHVDNGTKGTFELLPEPNAGRPLGANVLGSSMDTNSFNKTDGTKTIDTNPADDVKITPTAAVCSSCHDKREVIAHMIRTGGASFNATQDAIASGRVKERCASCHGPGKDKSVRKVHLSED